VSRRDEVHNLYDRLCWLYSPVCLEWREEAREEASPFCVLAELVRRTARTLARVLG
jgi:hypothetical protein